MGGGLLLTKDVRRQVHGKVEVKRVVGVKNTAGAFGLAPLHGDRDAAVEGVDPEDGEVGGADVGGHGVDGFAEGGSAGGKDAPVEG